jgi:hypothetical protein
MKNARFSRAFDGRLIGTTKVGPKPAVHILATGAPPSRLEGRGEAPGCDGRVAGGAQAFFFSSFLK